MASRDIRDLHPTLQPLCREFLRQCQLEGIDVIITCTYRSGTEQDALYAQGRTKAGQIVTNARAGESAHNYLLKDRTLASKAFDVVPMRQGKCVWGEKGEDGELWQRIGKIGTDLGLNWYGSPGSKFKESPHFQLKE